MLGFRVHPLRRRALVLYAAIAILLAVESIQFIRSGTSATSSLRYLIQSPPDNTVAAAGSDYGREAILPSADGRVLVTGGGGMIGKRVVRRLLRAQIPVTVLDRIFFDDEIDAIRDDYPDGDLDIVIGDLRNPDVLRDSMRGVKGVIHLAAVSRVLWCLENQPDCTDVNVRGTQLVLEAMKGGWFIQASSREVYGNPDVLPIEEDAPHSPANVYGKSKAEAEDVITSYVSKVTADGSKKLNAVILRLSNVYGSAKDHPERLIPAIMRNAISNRPIQMVGGDQDLDMVFVEDVVDAMSLAVSHLHAKTNTWLPTKGLVEVFNTGTSSSTSAMTLIRKTLWLTNSSSPLRTIPGDDRFPSRYVGSTVKGATVLGYKARVSIDEGLHRLATEFLQDTASYLRKKSASEPFFCGTKRSSGVKDLAALDGCTVTLSRSVNHEGQSGWIEYAHFVPAGKNDQGSWDDTSKWETVTNPALWEFEANVSDHETANVKFKLASKDLYFEEPPGTSQFVASVDPVTGFVNLGGEHTHRVTPICCADKPAPWPGFRDDAIASNILDVRTSAWVAFNASQMTTMCTRFKRAEDYAQARLDALDAFDHPIVLHEAELPGGRAPDWRMRKYGATCSSACDHPTLCVDTGDCLCGHAAACMPRTRFPFGDFANMPVLSYPPVDRDDLGDKALVDGVKRSSWANILNTDARRYFAHSPEWPRLTTVQDPDSVEEVKKEKGAKFFALQNSLFGCFSADTAMETAAALISKPYEETKSIVFLPFYNFNDFFDHPDPTEWIDNGIRQLSVQKEPDTADFVMPFTHDFGRCNAHWRDPIMLRRFPKDKQRHDRVTGWSPMGDLYSPCYHPDQDVVIPARTCLQDTLRSTFGDISMVKPVRQRSILTTFKGRTDFLEAGSIVRKKLDCKRKVSPGRLQGGDKLDIFWQDLQPNNDYTQTINDTVFCPLPRGTTGWATRTIDVIYGGCIPVLIGDQTHHMFWDVLDWSKFAVFINEWDIERLEDILLGYSWAELDQMQANLMLVRDAFLYPPDGSDMKEAVQERTPFWYAIHSTWLRKLTLYPV